MKISLSSLPIIACLLLCFALPADAARYGFFLDLAGGSGEAEWDSDSDEWDIDTGSFAVGLAIDSDPTPDQVFNLRLNIGLTSLDIEDENNDTLECGGIYGEAIFGFSPIRSTQMRWWIGPLVRIGYYHGEGEDFDVEVDFAEFAIGAATGWNIDLGSVVLSPSIGWRISGYAGDGEMENGFDDDWSGGASSVFFNFATLF